MSVEMVYVVMGSTGEYSDRTEWPVKAYRNEERAKEHVVNAEREAKKLQARYGIIGEIPKDANPYDTDMDMDYTGANYYYLSVELGE